MRTQHLGKFLYDTIDAHRHMPDASVKVEVLSDVGMDLSKSIKGEFLTIN
jgi:hypothetical protein